MMIDIQIALHPCEVQQFDQLLLPDLPSYVPGVLNPIQTGFLNGQVDVELVSFILDMLVGICTIRAPWCKIHISTYVIENFGYALRST